MTPTGNIFFTLLRYALWGDKPAEPISVDEATLDDILYEANDQTVIGLIADAILACCAPISPDMQLRLLGTVTKMNIKNEQFNSDLACLTRLPLQNYAVVKGQTVAALYPNPALRKPGDIDLLVRDYTHARRVLTEQWQVSLPERLNRKETNFKHNGVEYDIHQELIFFASRRHKHAWQTLMQRPFSSVKIDDFSVPTLEPTFNAAYLFAHLFFHFVREGIGLRHLSDIAVFLHAYRDQINPDELRSILSQLGLERAFRAFGTILTDYLGLASFPFPLSSADRKWGERILPDVLHGANFGRNIKNPRAIKLSRKRQTFSRALRTSCKYVPLAPVEMLLFIPKLAAINLRVLWGHLH